LVFFPALKRRAIFSRAVGAKQAKHCRPRISDFHFFVLRERPFLFAIRAGRGRFCAMSVEQIEASIEAMPVSERRKFVRWFDQHRHELLPEADDISPAVRAELELRLKETDEHPELLEPFAEADVERMFKEITDAHSQKTSVRQG
jgi:hypothetical protein